MATAAEKLAGNLNFGALGQATELRNRLLFTLGALIVFRLGTFLPIPGIKGCKIEIIISLLGFNFPFFGQVLPEFKAIGKHFKFNCS